jgi:hypothetical protein
MSEEPGKRSAILLGRAHWCDPTTATAEHHQHSAQLGCTLLFEVIVCAVVGNRWHSSLLRRSHPPLQDADTDHSSGFQASSSHQHTLFQGTSCTCGVRPGIHASVMAAVLGDRRQHAVDADPV